MIPLIARALVSSAVSSSKKTGKSVKAGINIEGIEGVQKDLDYLAEKFGQDVVEAAITAGQLVRTDAIDSIEKVSPGNEVTRTRLGGKKRKHIASLPGDAPNTDSGKLISTIQVEANKDGVYVGSELEYAETLEFGTRRMQPRPWLNPALEKNREKIREIFSDKINDRINLENVKK
jgi:HK97 gp10 family phage protein